MEELKQEKNKLDSQREALEEQRKALEEQRKVIDGEMKVLNNLFVIDPTQWHVQYRRKFSDDFRMVREVIARKDEAMERKDEDIRMIRKAIERKDEDIRMIRKAIKVDDTKGN